MGSPRLWQGSNAAAVFTTCQRPATIRHRRASRALAAGQPHALPRSPESARWRRPIPQQAAPGQGERAGVMGRPVAAADEGLAVQSAAVNRGDARSPGPDRHDFDAKAGKSANGVVARTHTDMIMPGSRGSCVLGAQDRRQSAKQRPAMSSAPSHARSRAWRHPSRCQSARACSCQ